MLCTGALGPESLLPDSRLLDTLLEEVQPEPLAPPAGKGMDGEWGSALAPRPRPVPEPPMLPLRRSPLLHLHIGDHGAAQGCHRGA